MLRFMNSKNNGSPQVMLGDFNVGPSIPEAGIEGEYEENFTTILVDGWIEANTDSASPFCTYCPEENETGLFEGDFRSAIDHIWVRNANVSNTKRILDKTFKAWGGTWHPSDHFGVFTKVSKN